MIKVLKCENIANFLFWEFFQKSFSQFEGNFYAYLHAKNHLHSTSFFRYFKEIANLLFWVIWACLATHKTIVSILGLLQRYACLLACLTTHTKTVSTCRKTAMFI